MPPSEGPFFILADEGVRARARLNAIVTVVDAKNLASRLADSEEAAAQIAFAEGGCDSTGTVRFQTSKPPPSTGRICPVV